MKRITLITIAVIAFAIQGYSQINFPIKFRVEKQSMSTPMTDIEDILFVRSYYARPVNIIFDGKDLQMVYDNGEVFTKKSLTKVNYETEYEEGKLGLESFQYTDDANPQDAVLFVVDYNVGYLQIILTTKNSKGENIGYTSYRQYVSDDQLALK